MPDAHTTAEQPRRSSEEELVRAHMPLVHYAVAEVAGRVPRHVGRDDLISAGMIGLAQAARSFDPARGIPFGRFASTRIRGALLDELRSRDWASRSVRAKARAVAAASERLAAQLGRTPTSDELAEAMGMTVAAVEAIAGDVHRAVVLNLDALPLEGRAEQILLVAEGTPDDAVLAEEQRRTMLAAVQALPERLRRVVIGCFFEDLPMQVLARELGVTDSRISQMRTEALALLKDGINSQLDPELVEDRNRAGRVARRKQAYYQAIAEHTSARERRSALPHPHLLSVA
ncbi:sigma-70 family RNA polymerase sigma factor [Acidiferrimicrobium sp. IK]|uniref:sigma-70 family RNA polymerase sigma factor n=1 Tax=Acidiferrimicrobium sp. IK TaxID=2871700 RepID=UPI0021CB0046|nr:sigma-70 family RNA polymerase sigma factor [Acidiferrimicrobium sp. IK]MCU4186936.1 sigma-70 family RNA polymerase sigma factor [Acidiferrimicrobium sp. IK]